MKKEKELLLQENFGKKIVDFYAEQERMSYSYSKQSKNEAFFTNLNYAIRGEFRVTWCLGGTYGNCWNDNVGTVSTDIEPSMKELDDFLMKSYPNTSFMQYKKIESIIDKSVRNESDYYGGRTQEGEKTVSFNALQDVLVSIGLEEYSEYVSVKKLVQDKTNELFPSSKIKKESETKSVSSYTSPIDVITEQEQKVPKKKVKKYKV
jgi:hypothetical protein